jgi:hypothetical protein
LLGCLQLRLFTFRQSNGHGTFIFCWPMSSYVRALCQLPEIHIHQNHFRQRRARLAGGMASSMTPDSCVSSSALRRFARDLSRTQWSGRTARAGDMGAVPG